MRHLLSAACGIILACAAAPGLVPAARAQTDGGLTEGGRTGQGAAPSGAATRSDSGLHPGPARSEPARSAHGGEGMARGAALPPSDQVVVVELFTSQGCVSCPPADEFFAMLTGDPRVIPLSLHVDYWDYIGWEDSFGNPRFTQRQKEYARAIGSRTIYTPQFIVEGEDRIEGFDPGQTAERIKAHFAAPSPVALHVSRQGDVLTIRAEADPPLTAPIRVQLVRYLPEETVTIERGENAGKTVTYRNVVTDWQVLGDWAGQAPLEIETAAPGAAPAVVILQNPGPSGILAAARAE